MLFAHTKQKFKPTIQATAVGLSIGIAFLQFCFIIVHQIYLTCFSCMRRKDVLEFQVNEEQAHAIYTRFKYSPTSIIRTPLAKGKSRTVRISKEFG